MKQEMELLHFQLNFGGTSQKFLKKTPSDDVRMITFSGSFQEVNYKDFWQEEFLLYFGSLTSWYVVHETL